MKYFYVLILFMAMCTFWGCATTDKVSDVLITENDFEVQYNNIMINNKLPITQIEQGLGIKFEDFGENIEQIGCGDSEGYNYIWNTLYFPNKENCDIEIWYIINKTLNTTTITSLFITNGKVNKNISIGDSVSDLLKAYGEPNAQYSLSDTTNGLYAYRLDSSNSNYEIRVIVDVETKKIKKVCIDYESDKIMNELDMYRP